MLTITAVLAAATLAPATVPLPPDEQRAAFAAAAALDVFTADLDAESLDYLAPVCTFWSVSTDNSDLTIWRCYATLGTDDDIVWDVATGIVTHDMATGETRSVETLAYAESGLLRLYCQSTGELSLVCP